MSKETMYNFLELEFKKLYEDMKIFNESTEPKKVFVNLQKLLNDIVYYIYVNNEVYYDKSLNLADNVQLLKEAKLINKSIEETFLKTFKNIKSYEEMIDEYYFEVDEDNIKVTNLVNKNFKEIYKLIIWLVLTQGKENYEFLRDNLNDEYKEVFDKYAISEDEFQCFIKNIDYYDGEDIKIKAAILVEEGEKYYFGKEVEKDYRKSLQYFLKAAECGDEYGEAYVGLFYDKGYAVETNYLVAFNWYYRAAMKGNAFSQNALGLLYINGRGIRKNYTAAMMWFQKSAENEYSPAFYQLGRIYYLGMGTEKDYQKAFYWYKKSADLDFAAAQYTISFMYKNGEGCEVNSLKAYYWIERAAENGYEDAYYIVGESYLNGIGYEINYEKAYQYLSKGYEACDLNCIESLGDMYLKGLYVEKNIEKALELYNLSIEYGSFELYFKVGKIYEGQHQISKAIDAYKQGHEQGELKCTQRLGVMYYNGEGISRDLNKAIEYMEIAAERKAPHAMYVLGVAYLRLNKFKEKTEEIAKELFQEAYELKSPYAAEYLAFISLNEYNEGKEINKNKLIEYIEFGSESGLPESIFQYGYIYENGIVVEQDDEKAYYYYSLCAESNYIKAMNKLGEWYLKGRFVKQDINLSIKWYERCAEKNDIESMEKLIEIYERAIGGKAEEIKALYYVFKLIEVDALKGKCRLAYYCFKGVAIEIDYKKGYEILSEIEDIDKGTSYNLKAILAVEKYIDLSTNEIVDLFLQGIDCGNSECYGNLALYLDNLSVEEKEKFKEQFQLALEGRKLGINKCKYVYIINKVRYLEELDIITLEEIALINKLKEMLNNGFYRAINSLLEWYEKRNMTNIPEYYQLKIQKKFYNIE